MGIIVGYITRFEIIKSERVTPQDLIDGIETLKPQKKVSISTKAPDYYPQSWSEKDPNHYLKWAEDELKEAVKSSGDVSDRKYFNVSVLSKCAVDCLVDWYIKSSYLDLTIRRNSSLIEKLEALDAENVFGISFSLFDNTIFGPRNRAVHQYRLVTPEIAKNSYDLAKLTIINCQNTKRPDLSTIFYGKLDTASGEEARKKAETNETEKGCDEVVYFGGFGPKDIYSVLIDGKSVDPIIVLLHSLGEGNTEVRYCSIQGS